MHFKQISVTLYLLFLFYFVRVLTVKKREWTNERISLTVVLNLNYTMRPSSYALSPSKRIVVNLLLIILSRCFSFDEDGSTTCRAGRTSYNLCGFRSKKKKLWEPNDMLKITCKSGRKFDYILSAAASTCLYCFPSRPDTDYVSTTIPVSQMLWNFWHILISYNHKCN